MNKKKIEILVSISMILAGVFMIIGGVYELKIIYILAIILFLIAGFANIGKIIIEQSEKKKTNPKDSNNIIMEVQ